ncbi:MAG: efflux RND transporter permease subunit [Flavobacteriales bacterium]|nr:MAG: efflux RND transporter permease subunit [Flavobacteriales bacterium]
MSKQSLDHTVKKEFSLSSKSIENKNTVFVLTVIIFLAGFLAYRAMPSEAFPEIVTPEIYISTPYPGNAPLDVEKLITRPLEKELNAISGVDEISSTSTQGFSSIRVKFDFSISPEIALQRVKDKVDIAKSSPDFPSDLPADPNVFELNFAELVPILNINLSGEFSADQLKLYAEYLEEKIEALPEISGVDIRGMDEKEVRISVDQRELELLNLSFNDIAQAIQGENVSVSGGDLLIDGFRKSVRISGDFVSILEIGDVIVKHEGGNIVYLRDIADISFGEKERESYAREFFRPVVMLDVKKRGGENLIIVSEKINQILVDAKNDFLPSNLDISITNDQSDSSKAQLSELENSIIFGVILVIVVLMFFLGLRNALFVGIAIPLSMLLSFFILEMLGITLNTVVLFALVLALGMLVDNGIVVVENIYRLMDEGKSPIAAAKQGVGEVAWAIIASTATTLAAFIPLAMWPGMFGEFMKFLPITLMTVLGSSLFVALVINPVLTSVYMKIKEDAPNYRRMFIFSIVMILVGISFLVMKVFWVGNLLIFFALLRPFNSFVIVPATQWFQNKFLPRIENLYYRTLTFALKGKKPIVFFVGSILLLVFSIFLIQVASPKVIFFPENQPKKAEVYVELPIGTDIEVTNEVALELENKLRSLLAKYYEPGIDTVEVPYAQRSFMVKSIIAQVGMGASDPNQGPSNAPTPHKARIEVSFVDFPLRRGVSTAKILEEIRNELRGYPGAQITVSKDAVGPPAGAPINIEVSGDDYIELLAEAENIRRFINEGGIRGIEELKLDVQMGKPELPIIVDRRKARSLGVSSGQIGDALRTALFGKEISTFKEAKEDYPINLRYKDESRYNLNRLLDTRITFRDPASGRIKQVPISAVADVQTSSTFNSVKRIDLNRVITISSNVNEGYNANETVEQIKERMSDYDMPLGMTLSFTGEQENQAKEMAFLVRALMIAVFLIFLIMVAQFNSATTPFIIMTTVVLSLIGVFLGLVITQMDFVVIFTSVGIISLAGIVVNNAIVLVDYANLLLSRKRVEKGLNEEDRLVLNDVYEAIVEAGQKRLRPVLLTAITTILGLLPLATGMNINFFTLVSAYDPQIYFGGDNAAFWGPMAWTVIYGLTFATFLTLVMVPVMLYLLSAIKSRFGMRVV